MVDNTTMSGTWIVTYGKYKYDYSMDKAGNVRWRDFWDKSTTGVGRFSISGTTVTFRWTGSTTSESWTVGDDGVGALGNVNASYGTFDDLQATKSTSASDTSNLMQQWAACIDAGIPFSSPNVCGFAIPYTALANPKYPSAPGKSSAKRNAITLLDKENIGGPLQRVRGLAMHTTAGNEGRTTYQTGIYGCVGTWNARRNSGEVKAVSAHFAIAIDGTLIQIVPTNLIAWAQGGIADQYYISVEVENNGDNPMRVSQLETSKKLFSWVVNSFGVPRKLATGLIGGKFKQYDSITTAVCQAAGADLTYDPKVSAAASGLSCHQWLHPKKCPGPGILGQMASIVNAAPVS